MVIKFSLERCKTRAAFSAKLLQKGRINLDKVKAQFSTLVDTPILLVISVNSIEIIVHRYGELLFKKSEDTAVLERIAEQVYNIGLE